MHPHPFVRTTHSRFAHAASCLPGFRDGVTAALGCCVLLLISVQPGLAQTTSYFNDGFETAEAQDCWFSDAGFWEIGVPTSGPATNSAGGRAHQGINVAATVLDGDYTDDRESRLISCPILVPVASQNPRLRFWHWWSFGPCDYGQVHISTNNGASWIELSGYVADSSGQWTRGWLDLTPYAGRTVRLGFFLHANSGFGCSGVGPGWYLDEIVVESGPLPTTISPDSLEDLGAPDRWSADQGIWEIGVPTSGPPTNSAGSRAHHGTNVAATILNGTYTDDRESRLSSRPFTVPDVNPRLRFWHWWSFGPCDYGQVQISTNNGASWIELSGYAADSSGQWTRGWLDLTPYAGRTARLGLFLHANSGFGCGGIGAGWYVDEIMIESGPLATMTSPDSLEDSEAPNRWTADQGVWEIGVPTSGPGNAHAGSNCLGTVLSGDYTDDRESRVSSQPFVIPPATTNPRLRFWHWWSFGPCDFGQVQVSTNNGSAWTTLATFNASAPWTQRELDFTSYAGQTVRLGFFFHANSGFGCGGVGAGWYIDEVRLLHDFALLFGSTIVRTQEVACVPVRIFASDPVTNISFTLDASVLGSSNSVTAAHLLNASLNTGNRFASVSIVPGANSRLHIGLRTHPTNALIGDETIGSLCLPSNLAHSALVGLQPGGLGIVTASGTSPRALSFAGRTVIVAQDPLLETWMDPNRQPMLTTYGKPDTGYAIRYATNLATAPPWPTGMTNLVPASMSVSQPLGTLLTRPELTNAPWIFLRASQR